MNKDYTTELNITVADIKNAGEFMSDSCDIGTAIKRQFGQEMGVAFICAHNDYMLIEFEKCYLRENSEVNHKKVEDNPELKDDEIVQSIKVKVIYK